MSGARGIDRGALELVKNQRIIIVLGAGGVGKTTNSIALAFAAAKLGRRVALLSIDPAKRLADALGIKLSGKLAKIDTGSGISGEIHGAMLDQKAVFDQMVERNAPSAKVASQILDHPVYQAASTNLSGPLEYMALAKLAELVEDDRFDLIVLDTPPDTHALDFLKRPNVLAGFMENKVMSWLIKPFALAGKLGAFKLLSVGERLMGGIAKVTGVKALHTFAEFLVLVQEVIDGFHKTGQRIQEILGSRSTSFCLVTIPTNAALRSARNIVNHLEEMAYGLDLVLLNRCLPLEILEDHSLNPGATDDWLTRRCVGEIAMVQQVKTLFAATSRQRPILRLVEQDYDLHSREAILRFVEQYSL